MRLRALVMAVVTSGAVLAAAPGAWADPGDHQLSGTVDVNGNGVREELSGSGSGDTTGGGGGGGGNPCVYERAPDYQPHPGEPEDGQDGGHWYAKFCPSQYFHTLEDYLAFLDQIGDGLSVRSARMIAATTYEYMFLRSAPDFDPRAYVWAIARNTPLPDTVPAASPALDKQVVNLPTWLWLASDTAPRSDTLRGPDGSDLRVVIRLEKVVWDTGDGGHETCRGPGTRYTPGHAGEASPSCGHTYRASGHYRLAATAYWTVDWWLNGARQPSLGPITRTSPDAGVAVREIQSVVTDAH